LTSLSFCSLNAFSFIDRVFLFAAINLSTLSAGLFLTILSTSYLLEINISSRSSFVSFFNVLLSPLSIASLALITQSSFEAFFIDTFKSESNLSQYFCPL